MLFKCLLVLLLINFHFTVSQKAKNEPTTTDEDSSDERYKPFKKRRPPQHKVPINGTGTILISYNDTNPRHRNHKRILIVFDLLCVNNVNESDARLMIKMDHIHQKYSQCLNFSDSSVRHYDTLNYSYVWMDLHCKLDIIQKKKNISINYNELCIEYIMYEPVFYSNQTDTPTVNTTTPPPPPHQCNTINTEQFKSWGQDLLDSPHMDGAYHLVNISSVRDNPNGLDLFVIDSGIQAEHIEFNSGQVIHQMGNGPSTMTDKSGNIVYDVHGTHVAGLMGGKNYGTSHGVTIYDYRVCEFDDQGEVPCYTSKIVDALERILSKLQANPGRRGVINLSLGGEKTTATNDIYQSYFDKLLNAGGIPVVAGGNENVDACNVSPAYSTNAITVGAFDSSRRKAWFSNWGNCVDIWGPGEQIWSSVPSAGIDKYAFLSGTSMASPMIAGVVGNILAVSPSLNKGEIMKLLLNDSVKISFDKCEEYECLAPLYFCGAKVFGDGSWEFTDPMSTLEIILIIIGCGVGVCVIVLCILYIMKQKKKVPHKRVPDNENPNVNDGNISEEEAMVEGNHYNNNNVGTTYDVYQ
eukprot:436316_1